MQYLAVPSVQHEEDEQYIPGGNEHKLPDDFSLLAFVAGIGTINSLAHKTLSPRKIDTTACVPGFIIGPVQYKWSG